MRGHRVALAATAVATALMANAAPAASRSRADLDCTYQPRAGQEVTTFHHCARTALGGRPQVTSQHLRRLQFDRHGLSAIFIGQWYAIRRGGRLAPVMMLDNWAEPFSDGLARSPVAGKIGYIDRGLRLAIPARYDGAYPFDHGHALVCIGCAIRTTDEHSSYVGGVWRCIDRRGRETEVARPAEPACPLPEKRS